MIGFWKALELDQSIPNNISNWNNKDTYEKNTIVLYRLKYYIAMGDNNVSQPNDILAVILYVSLTY